MHVGETTPLGDAGIKKAPIRGWVFMPPLEERSGDFVNLLKI